MPMMNASNRVAKTIHLAATARIKRTKHARPITNPDGYYRAVCDQIRDEYQGDWMAQLGADPDLSPETLAAQADPPEVSRPDPYAGQRSALRRDDENRHRPACPTCGQRGDHGWTLDGDGEAVPCPDVAHRLTETTQDTSPTDETSESGLSNPVQQLDRLRQTLREARA